MYKTLVDWPASVTLGGETCDYLLFCLLVQHTASCDGLLLTGSCCVSVFLAF